MPGKSRHGRGKRSFHGQKGKSRGTAPVTLRQPETGKPVVPVAPAATGIDTQYPHTLIELRRIGILAGIMLTILVVLALVLP